METEVIHLETALANRLQNFSKQDIRHVPSSKRKRIEKYSEIMELTKCLRRQQNFLLYENQKRKKFAEKVQQTLPHATDSLQLLRSIRHPADRELGKILQSALDEMLHHRVSGQAQEFFGWTTRCDLKPVYLHMISEKTFEIADISEAVDKTWLLHTDEVMQSRLDRRRTKFCILKKVDDNTLLVRDIHQFTGESFSRHSISIIARVQIEKDVYGILVKSILPLPEDAHYFVWTDECYLWKFEKTQNENGSTGFRVAVTGKYGSTSAAVKSKLVMLESYFILAIWESLAIHQIFDFSSRTR
ncbi:unnamed protein product [Albugo candida]|uniref:START domain-containing protein n=1 Tax=Albugo candida TaxID=65357 RepID=A0A024GLI2_9STRA|nr:unnamed protein product [Albugo candida]|eukprot:CCI47585.1 unnamed protein product [Albugo candida]